ncbi:MAG: hypothetical protein AABW91_02510 [Nanoarchaeota archaeon]
MKLKKVVGLVQIIFGLIVSVIDLYLMMIVKIIPPGYVLDAVGSISSFDYDIVTNIHLIKYVMLILAILIIFQGIVNLRKD